MNYFNLLNDVCFCYMVFNHYFDAKNINKKLKLNKILDFKVII